jgi:hypothetical protein
MELGSEVRGHLQGVCDAAVEGERSGRRKLERDFDGNCWSNQSAHISGAPLLQEEKAAAALASRAIFLDNNITRIRAEEMIVRTGIA